MRQGCDTSTEQISSIKTASSTLRRRMRHFEGVAPRPATSRNQSLRTQNPGTDPVLSQVMLKSIADLTYHCQSCNVNHATGYRCRADRKLGRALARIALVKAPVRTESSQASTLQIKAVR